MAGSAAWLQDSDEDAATLRAEVYAPGGAGSPNSTREPSGPPW